jgi:hypothetical protein
MNGMRKSTGKKDTLRRELHDALLGTVLDFHAAWRRFERHRRHRGLDYGCLRLLDEAHVARSLVLAVADEVRRYSRRAALQ